MTIGQTQNITLRSKGDRHNNLWLCFTTDKYVTIWNISLNSSCTECFLRSVDCPELRNRPHWNVSRNQVLNCSSNYLLELTVVVTNARKEDSGRFMLTWSSDSSDTGPKNHPVLTVTSLNVTSSDSNNDRGLSREYIYIYSGVGGVGVGLLVVVCVVVTVAVRCKVRRQPVRRDHRRRRRKFLYDYCNMVFPVLRVTSHIGRCLFLLLSSAHIHRVYTKYFDPCPRNSYSLQNFSLLCDNPV